MFWVEEPMVLLEPFTGNFPSLDGFALVTLCKRRVACIVAGRAATCCNQRLDLWGVGWTVVTACSAIRTNEKGAWAALRGVQASLTSDSNTVLRKSNSVAEKVVLPIEVICL